MKKFLSVIFVFFLLAVSVPSAGDKHYSGIVDIYLDIAKGNIPGHSSINKFGHNPAVATTGEDVWSGGGDYAFFPDTAKVMEIYSDSAVDSSGGAGAWTVIVYGLDSNWLEINETVTLEGRDSVVLAKRYIRIYRAIVYTAGSYKTNKGSITIQDTAGGVVGAYITAGDGQTQQAIYTVPAGKTAYFIKGYAAMENDDKNGADATFVWKTRWRNGGNGAWAVKGQIELINIGSSWWQYQYGVPSGGLPEKTDIKMECIKTSATSGATAGFDLILVDN